MNPAADTRIIRTALLIALLAAAAGLGAAQPADYIIQPGDILGITVWRNPDLDTETEVDPEGNITLPLLGKVSTEGLTARALEDTLTRRWGEEYIKKPYVRVHLQKKQFFVLGEVKQPGSYELVGNITVLKSISMAGGFTDYAAEGRVLILRGKNSGKQTLKVDVGEINKGKAEDIELRPGDIVTVPQSIF